MSAFTAATRVPTDKTAFALRASGFNLLVLLAGGLGGYARYTAICPAQWKYGVSVGEVAEAPLPKSDKILHWDSMPGIRVRK